MRCDADKSLNNIRSFTLTELLITVSIIVVLMSVVTILLNPLEYLGQGRDSTRIADIDSLNTAVGLYASSVRGYKGDANVVYISIPDTSSTCANITGLPTLSGGWIYHCVATANLRNTDGTGWLPVNLSALMGGSPVEKLPIDPTNASAGYQFYSYAVSSSGWELNATTESKKTGAKFASDGGSNALFYEAGKSLAIVPEIQLGRSCKLIQTSFPRSPDGVYWIDPDGAGAEPNIQVYCDMTTDGGGWTLVQSTVKDQPANAQWSAAFPSQLDQTIGSPSLDTSYRLAMKYWYIIPNTSWAKMGITATEKKKSLDISSTFSLTGVNAGPTGFTYTGSDPARVLNSLSSYNWNSCTNGISYFNTSCCSTCIYYYSSSYNTYNQPMLSIITAVDGSTLQKWNGFAPLDRLNIFSR